MNFEAFGRHIVVYKKDHKTFANTSNMATSGHFLLLTDSAGNVIGRQISLELLSPLNGPPCAIVELFVDLTEIKKIE